MWLASAAARLAFAAQWLILAAGWLVSATRSRNLGSDRRQPGNHWPGTATGEPSVLRHTPTGS
ncbi:MAG: hypothetical protein AABP62_27565 [Planctomycetota bacterium]